MPAPFDPGPLAQPEQPPRAETYRPATPSGLAKMIPGAAAKRQRLLESAQALFEEDYSDWQAAEQDRLRRLEDFRSSHEARERERHARVESQNEEIDQFVADLLNKSANAVVDYFSIVLSSSVWPDGFPHDFALAYDTTSSLLGVDYVLPSLDVVPDVKTFRYIKKRDEIATTALPATRRKAIYTQLVTQSALRVLHEVIESDRFGLAETVALNCFVDTTDPATGQNVQPCIVSVRTTRDVFSRINLDQVDPAACLKGLSASVSTKPSELVPVRPVVELKMIDPRFVEEEEILSELDQRPNLLALTPQEFESLITNLFTAMGLETRQTQPSRDGGVDCVAYDQRPIFGGKVVIQAKRYKNTVGVASVRDLYGTVQNEGASKGILVTTSGYGKASYEFAEGKPLELLSGPNLLYLLEEHAGIKAKIVVPTEWEEPAIEFKEAPVTVEPPPTPSTPGSNPQTEPFPQPRSGRT